MTMNRVFDWIAAALLLAALVWASASPVPADAGCTTDTDCMERFGGDGSPAPADECDTFDCWE